MSEELSQTGGGVGDGVPSGTPDPTTGSGAERQPEAQEKQQKINLDDLPEYRRVKSSYDQQIAQARKQAAEAQKQADELRMAQMDEQQKLQFQLEREREARERLQRDMQQMQLAGLRQQRIQEIHTRTGVPLDALPANAQSDQELYEAALSWMTQNVTASAQVPPADRSANNVDLGSGQPRSEAADREKQIEEAKKNGDSLAYLRLVLGDS